MVKFIKTISFGYETQSLIAVLTLYSGFHAFSTTPWLLFHLQRKQSTLLFIQSGECIPGTFWQRGRGVCLVTSLVSSGGKEDCVLKMYWLLYLEGQRPYMYNLPYHKFTSSYKSSFSYKASDDAETSRSKYTCNAPPSCYAPWSKK
jgi:hypothetical protein